MYKFHKPLLLATNQWFFGHLSLEERNLDHSPICMRKKHLFLTSSALVRDHFYSILWVERKSHLIDRHLQSHYGILLSPNVDSLFDKHLISFTDNGDLIKSSKISFNDLLLLGIEENVKIPVSEGMKKYLKKHRGKLNEVNS